jgi:hypothetical protein
MILENRHPVLATPLKPKIPAIMERTRSAIAAINNIVNKGMPASKIVSPLLTLEVTQLHNYKF